MSVAESTHTIEDVVARGMCVGCGACSVATSGRVVVRFTSIGMRQADLEGVSPADIARGDQVCPFSDNAPDEDQLDAPTDWGRRLSHDHRIGRYSLVAAGRRVDESALLESSSGGLTSWIVGRLLKEGLVDGILHVGDGGPDGLFSYNVSHSLAEADGRRKSKYYAVTLAELVQEIQGNGKRYAIVGIPCFIKAARLLALQNPALAEQFAYYVGLVCGHLKTRFFAESLAWQIGVPPEQLASVDFRVKNPERPASRYDMAVSSADDPTTVLQHEVAKLLGGSWGHAVFQPEGCNFCDDIFAETADVVFGDAWLPQYSKDWRGNNVLVSRNEQIDELLRAGQREGEIQLDEIDVAAAVASQAGNYRHRRDGLAVRLHDDIRAGLSVPRKRVSPGLAHVTRRRVKLIRQRRRISALSFGAFRAALASGRIETYLERLRPELSKHDRLSKKPFAGMRRRLQNLVRRLRRGQGAR
ncbi:coenzyme F420 hydrogenase [Microbacterium barkeri]|uniref:Coenzyme F420 hydrogenase n=1 Tax=Microbacterium barkeri TaxID=33917 RepID=A0A9W6LVU8_9MICO|nr:coenzyme F420 hydrogenase [Microbacterium barkeri]